MADSKVEVSDPTKDDYVLGRSYVSATRLNSQHYLIKDAQGFLLHPQVRQALDERPNDKDNETRKHVKVADLGTGTGVWLIDLMQSTEVTGLKLLLHGFDISPNLYPNKVWLPPNISFQLSNILGEPPREFWNTFDVVHLRLVMSVVRDGNPRPIIWYIYKLLRPGGFLQWTEYDLVRYYDIVTQSPGVEAPHMTSALARPKSWDFSWVEKLPGLLSECGFIDAAQHHYEPSTSSYHAWTCNELSTFEELSYFARGVGNTEQWREDIREAYSEAHNESIGAALRICPVTTIARKKLDWYDDSGLYNSRLI